MIWRRPRLASHRTQACSHISKPDYIRIRRRIAQNSPNFHYLTLVVKFMSDYMGENSQGVVSIFIPVPRTTLCSG